MATLSFQSGQILNNRYQIHRLIASEANSDTYEGEDMSLQRPIALRVLGFEALGDAQWREYFRHQVTAVAALHHPNLVRIYDWGEEDGSTYLVTEFLPGGSLRDVLRERGTLSKEQTAMLGLETATALAYAHARGFVHGALRPSKILFDAEGRVRISDLGIAAPLASALPPAPTMETARYESPEHVLGEPIDGRSDVYSLALILFECLTGVVPHDGLTPAAVRTNRLGTPLPHRSELGPFDLLLALGAAPEASARPDAELFANRLESVAATLPLPRPVTLSPDNLGGFKVPSANEVLSAPAVAVAGRDYGDEAQGDPVVRPFDMPGYRENFEATAAAPSRRNAPVIGARGLLGVIGALVLIIGLGTAWTLGVFATTHVVTNLVGLNYTEALAAASNGNFTITVDGRVYSSSVPANAIVSQRPSAGTSLADGSTIHVTVSQGRASVTVPNVIGMGCNAATEKLVSLGLTATCPGTAAVTSQSIPRSAVAAYWFGNVKNPNVVPKGSAIVLAISTGPATTGSTTTTTTAPPGHAPRAVPNLVGMNRAQTLAAMRASELYVVTLGPGSNDGSWTVVLTQSPSAGTMVAWHSNVTVHVK